MHDPRDTELAEDGDPGQEQMEQIEEQEQVGADMRVSTPGARPRRAIPDPDADAGNDAAAF